MTVYNKLVRDKIPGLIRQQGAKPLTRVLDDEEYAQCLADKLNEEVAEFQRDRNVEELADILGSSRTELMEEYQKKHDTRGGFANRVFLISKEDKCL